MAIISHRETGMEHVQNLLAYGTSFSIRNSTANENVISYFSALSDFLADQEQKFYNVLSVQDISGLNQLLQQVNIDYNLSALDAGGTVFQEIKNRYVFKDKSKSDEQKEQKQEQELFNLITQLMSNIDADTFIERYKVGFTREQEYMFNGFVDALASVLDGFSFGNGLITYRFTAYGKGTSSLTGYYSKKEIGHASLKIINLNKLFDRKNPQAKISIDNNHFKIEGNSQALTESVQKEFRERIRPEIENYLNIEYQNKRLLENMSTEQIRIEVLDIIKEKGIILDNDDLAAAKKIAIGRGSGNISGFLGELQSRLYFKALFANIKDAQIIDQGASLINSLGGSGQMDPTDLQIKILNEIFNIQVKNYAKGGAEWSGATDRIVQTLQGEKKVSGTSGAKSFVLNRLQTNDSNLINFFGAATWHNLNPAYANDPKYGEYSGLYSNFQRIFSSLKDAFDTFLPNIIRLTAILEGAEDLSYENFYFQKGKMIPSSAIVNCIIDGITGSTKKVFKSSYDMYPGSSQFTYQHPFEDNYSSFADETAIAWNVTISFSSVLHSIGL